jgi:hypothetical protein
VPVEVRAGGRQRWLENGRRGEAVERGEAGGGGAAKVEEVASPRHRALEERLAARQSDQLPGSATGTVDEDNASRNARG